MNCETAFDVQVCSSALDWNNGCGRRRTGAGWYDWLRTLPGNSNAIVWDQVKYWEYPSDYQAGFDSGRAVGEKVVAYARQDGFAAVCAGTVPTGPGMWVGVNPSFPLAGSWKPWLLSSGSQFRPGPPPALDSPKMAAELWAGVHFRSDIEACLEIGLKSEISSAAAGAK